MKKLITAFFLLFLFTSINHSNAKGWLGIQFLPLNDETIKGFVGEGSLEKDSPKNLLVSGVIKNSPAHLANLLPGDIILEADNKPTKEIKDLLDILDNFSTSETINIKIFRKGTEKILKVKLGKTPTNFTFEYVDGSEKYTQFTFGVIIAWEKFISYEKYFSKEIVNKYKKEGLVVSCIYEGSDADKKGIKLYDEIIMIDGKKATKNSYAFIKGKYNELTIKRGNKIITGIYCISKNDLKNIDQDKLTIEKELLIKDFFKTKELYNKFIEDREYDGISSNRLTRSFPNYF